MLIIVRVINKTQRISQQFTVSSTLLLPQYLQQYYSSEEKRSHSKLQLRMLSSGVMRNSGILVFFGYIEVYVFS